MITLTGALPQHFVMALTAAELEVMLPAVQALTYSSLPASKRTGKRVSEGSVQLILAVGS